MKPTMTITTKVRIFVDRVVDVTVTMCCTYISAIVNRTGHDCPHSLKLIVCLLLYEIVVFLREIYPTLPKLSSVPLRGSNAQRVRTNNAHPTLDVLPMMSQQHLTEGLRTGSFTSQTSNRSTVSSVNEQSPGPYRYTHRSRLDHSRGVDCLTRAFAGNHHQHESSCSRQTHQFRSKERSRCECRSAHNRRLA